MKEAFASFFFAESIFMKHNQKNIIQNEDLPGDLAIWIFILAEMLVFGVLFVVFAFSRTNQLAIFNASQLTLSRTAGTVNTVILITSSYFVVQSISAIKEDKVNQSANWLMGTIVLGSAFVVIKLYEFHEKFMAGVSLDTNDFYMFYLTLTSFHLMHVVMGIIILSYIALKIRKGGYNSSDYFGIESGASFWHMVDLLWIILFPLIYIIR